MSRTRLTEAQIVQALSELNVNNTDGWALVDNKLHRSFSFPNFVAAFGFMTQIALHAERLNHHPEWFNVYGTVRVDLTTHDAGGITQLDLDMARAMNATAAAPS